MSITYAVPRGVWYVVKHVAPWALASCLSNRPPRTWQVYHRCLALLSDNDQTLPSADEGRFLEANLKHCRTRVLKGSGHALLQEDGVDLMSILEVGECLPRKGLLGVR